MTKHLLLCMSLWLGAATLGVGAGHAQAAVEAEAKAGTLKMVQGDVRVVDVRGERAVQPGDTVTVADSVVTGANGSASLVLRDGTALVLGPKTRIELKNYAFDETSQKGNMLVSVLQGSLRMITGLISKTNPGAAAVTTKTATIGVRGTDFIVQVDDTIQ